MNATLTRDVHAVYPLDRYYTVCGNPADKRVTTDDEAEVTCSMCQRELAEMPPRDR